jgi:hypothetical protein
MQLRSVEIASGAILIRADSADFDPAMGQLKPRGKVTINLQKIAGGVSPSLTRELLPRSIR